MISDAKHARAIANESCKNQLEQVLEAIEESAKEGHTTLNYTGSLSNDQMRYLGVRGFRVDWNRACMWYEIRW